MTAPHSTPRIVIAGGGVAAIEAMLALRALAGPRPAITLLADEPHFSPPATSVATPFGFGEPASIPLGPLAERHNVRLQRGRLAEVDVIRRLAIPDDGEPLAYDHLVIAVGAPRRAAVAGATTFRGPRDVAAVEALLDRVVAGTSRRLVVAVPGGGAWPLPAYELAIMAAVELRSRGMASPEVAITTPEAAPLAVFGAAATEAMTRLLADRGIELHLASTAVAVADGLLSTAEGGAVRADAVIALPESVGPSIPGLPRDPAGFLPTDAHGRIDGCDAVYAAGDATSFPVRQGGLAAQQADAVAETIASRLGAIAHPQPFRPVLRGVLLTGGAPLYLRAEIGTDVEPISRPLGEAGSGSAGPRSLWWPPAKVAGRYLAPLLATARPVSLLSEPMHDLADARPAQPGDRDDALALALALADEDASCGDYREALHALDAARTLTGGVLPDAYADKERDWLSRA
ncbi:MAG TPA: FAD-dependent oxidoreductase [Solirubrobacteraceae bacterium]|nr:FAD-dependent oxidoreductase [Solirubrobacteraceae bacterium]